MCPSSRGPRVGAATLECMHTLRCASSRVRAVICARADEETTRRDTQKIKERGRIQNYDRKRSSTNDDNGCGAERRSSASVLLVRTSKCCARRDVRLRQVKSRSCMASSIQKQAPRQKPRESLGYRFSIYALLTHNLACYSLMIDKLREKLCSHFFL